MIQMNIMSTAVSVRMYHCFQVFDPVLSKQKVPTSVEDYMASLMETAENREKLNKLFAGMKSLTGQESLFHTLR